jgi:hypothetical protein
MQEEELSLLFIDAQSLKLKFFRELKQAQVSHVSIMCSFQQTI